jgi:hypothetical protein
MSIPESVQGEIEPPRVCQCQMRGKNKDLGQGAIPHSETKLREEIGESTPAVGANRQSLRG